MPDTVTPRPPATGSELDLDTTSDRRQVVRLRGALTGACANRLLDALRTVHPAPRHVEIDLSGVTTVDRSGATLLLDAYVATLLRRGAFALSGLSPTCRHSLLRFGVLDVVDLMTPSVSSRVPRRVS